jgi:hypothetical protein
MVHLQPRLVNGLHAARRFFDGLLGERNCLVEVARVGVRGSERVTSIAFP